ncbi:MAG: hypothetical protein N4J56_002860 [Chroococcidiopsis sp. SAG 2025]|uniref:PriCT-2 domain-containing protein n=1 Tax=Chroococcidiopsis sp. SAG 2025 TaxID=171389 RepID=UPI0029370DA6|nr:PriCT-2 domain-containing protein [Chroococcidiopsis sp. SAG 2025]MDV2993206.1 hypothetical protein [Chroococcidiopsis sp. SAG 2025]
MTQINTRNPLQQNLLTELSALPDDWRFTPVNGNKQPYLEDWQIKHFSKKELAEHIKYDSWCRAIGLLCGTPSGGLLLVDFDGESCNEYFPKLFDVPVSGLPDTVTVTSGRPGRCQRVYRVPQEYWSSIKSKDFKTGVKGDDGKDEQIELRWDGRQSVVAGAHPKTGSYKWLPGKSHREVAVAEAPIYLIDKMKRPVDPPRPVYTRNYNGNGDVALARECLAALNPCRAGVYQSDGGWLDVGMALHSVGDDSLLDDWDRWSQQSDKYKSGECEKKWSSFRGSGLNIGSLCYWAKQDGWKSSKQNNQGRQEMSVETREEEFKIALTEICKEEDPDLVALKKATVATNFKISVQEINRLLKQKEQAEEARHVEDYVFNTDSLFEEELAEDFLVPGILPRGGSVILAGDAKAGKTLLLGHLV